jgi:hypothetical protein
MKVRVLSLGTAIAIAQQRPPRNRVGRHCSVGDGTMLRFMSWMSCCVLGLVLAGCSEADQLASEREDVREAQHDLQDEQAEAAEEMSAEDTAEGFAEEAAEAQQEVGEAEADVVEEQADVIREQADDANP